MAKKDSKKIDKKKLRKSIEEFKNFVIRGNALDLAVGVIVGGAFGKIVSSLVNDILMPIIGIFLGGLDFTNLSITIKDAKIMYGSFIQNIIDLLIISLCVFIIVKIVNKIFHTKKKEEVVEKKVKSDEVIILEEIRDLLKKSKK